MIANPLFATTLDRCQVEEWESPFSPVLAAQAAQLPPVLRTQYLLPAGASYEVRLTGQMDRIWHSARWLRPYFSCLAWFDIIFPEAGQDVPTSVAIRSGRDRQRRPVHHWQRVYHFPGRVRYSNATLVYDPVWGQPVERFRPAGMICVAWDVCFHPPESVVITTTDYAIRIGRLRLSLPDWLRGEVQAIERAGQDNQVHIEFTLSYPRLGTVFGYRGSFRCRVQPFPES
ncbi:MAG: DUF4166 domain-containing protein [Chloroflexi bacterium]|nr:DUF4166 domain-containing protein [Chloroflexota bacterium]MCI0576812.1 DUF4166 domain-containing protein [Chloroflexota bacterium]MCI0647573.1 DUF4166 domain-containing protein [Chloroflexota bacterium]MCI0729107.1 DUF4166 domain-containing protein [Chloroflexota bacterium]